MTFPLTKIVFRRMAVLSLCVLLATPALARNTDAPSQSRLSRSCEYLLVRSRRAVQTRWRNYRDELREQGPIRLLLAPRKNPEAFDTTAAFLDPLIDLPIELASTIKHKIFHRPPLRRRVSVLAALPIGFLAWGLAFQSVDHLANSYDFQALENDVKADMVGADYVSQWVVQGGLSASDAARMLAGNESALENRLQPLYERIRSFQTKGVWTQLQVDWARATLNQVIKAHSPKELLTGSSLFKILASNPTYKKLNESMTDQTRFSLKLWPEPRVVYRSKADADWLRVLFDPSSDAKLTESERQGLRSLRDLSRGTGSSLSPAILVKLTADTLGDPSAISQKEAKARQLKISPANDFVHRADIPLFSVSTQVHDLKRSFVLSDELDRWHLFLSDPRFAALKTAWESKRLDDVSFLMESTVYLKALEQINGLAQNGVRDLTQKQSCELIYGQGNVPANPLFAPLRTLEQRLQRTSVEHLRWQLARLYFQTFLKMESMSTSQEVTQIFQNSSIQEATTVAQRLKSEPPSNENLPACGTVLSPAHP